MRPAFNIRKAKLPGKQASPRTTQQVSLGQGPTSPGSQVDAEKSLVVPKGERLSAQFKAGCLIHIR